MISIGEAISEFKDKDPVFVPLRGNAGDSFISHCTFQEFKRCDLKFELGHEGGCYQDRWVIFSGGGNLVRPYANGRRFLERNLNKWRRLLILPHTIRAYEKEIWNELKTNCTVFCREQPSHDFLRSNTAAETLLSHDMAFYWDRDDTRRQFRSRILKDVLRPGLFFRNSKRAFRSVKYIWQRGFGTEPLSALRRDIERSCPISELANIDISQAFSADDMSEISSLHATGWMMEFIGLFDSVRTDRLHVSIMAALMGRRVELFDNSYGKNSSVFEHSMRMKFPNVALRL